jgi:hypothetical protein
MVTDMHIIKFDNKPLPHTWRQHSHSLSRLEIGIPNTELLSWGIHLGSTHAFKFRPLTIQSQGVTSRVRQRWNYAVLSIGKENNGEAIVTFER